MEINSIDYHDYVFKDGKVIYEFDQMYQKSIEIPWHQDTGTEKTEIKIFIKILSQFSSFKNILDVGCGLGYFVDALKGLSSEIYGFDISPTAIKKARELFPDVHFGIYDVMSDDSFDIFDVNEFDLVTIRATFWYVFTNIDNVVENLHKMVKKNGYIVIHQNFPDLNRDFIGKDVIPNPETLLNFFTDKMELVIENRFQDYREQGGNDLWVTYVLKKVK